jgi:enediyne biosynthesis protein E4
MSKLLPKLILFFFVCCLLSCTENKQGSSSTKSEITAKIFDQLSPEESGISFSNNLKEDSIINYFTYPYIYMGGGVAIGDVNNDGFQDVYFTGNMVQNKLFLNNGKKGSLSFKDITAQANVGGDDRWMTGATMADVNADGWMDIYVSVSGKFTTQKNLLYINDGVLKDGIPSFTERAEERGLADEGRSTQGTFFDYDKDGDLDLYVANYPFTNFKTPNYSYQIYIQQKDPEKSDKLYRNDGTGYFEEVTAAAGVLNFGLSLSATVGDFNQDGWEDIYVSNDFASPDILYINNQDGTFSDKIKETTQHTAFFGMGSDAGDFNNDGLLDILQMDMTPESNRRNKANMASMNIPSFWEVVSMGMHYQYMQNALQLNNGIGEDGLPHFSDISRLAGMSSTDWSWACLFADLDNDGWKDVFITNGTRRDINNKDYFNEIKKTNAKARKEFTKLDLSQNIPSESVDNYAFKNNGDLTFQPVISEWGLSFKGFSNGAAYADLDNDGDLDMVVNNIDEPSLIYQNRTSDQKLSNYIRVQFKGNKLNPFGLGTKVLLKNKGTLQYQELTLTRGFQSSVEPVLHFGLGQETSVDEIIITWPDGRIQKLNKLPANQVLTIDYQNATDNATAQLTDKKEDPLFLDVTAELGIDFRHTENEFDDFKNEILLPHGYSKNGPGLAVGDVNGDGLEDFYIGAALGRIGSLYFQKQEGTFYNSENSCFKDDASAEDMGAVFFDADNDKDLDLYVVSGGNERKEGSPTLGDRLYINDGLGRFEKSKKALPELFLSGSRVKASDYDGDGDLDLFVGGRTVPQSYPLPAKSTILRNDFSETGTVKFTDVTEEIAPYLKEAGLVTDAVWVDFNQDKKLDLVLVGEWMPLTFLQNTEKGFINKTEEYGLDKTTGWWYSIIAEDFDNDGDIDFVAGNLGLNYKYKATPDESFDVYANDYDKNGKLDIVLGYYNDGIQYPVRGKQCSSEQIPTIKYKYKDYNSFAEASIEDVYTKQDLANSLHYQAWTFASSYIENRGNQDFEIKKLPNAAQLSSINGIVAGDYNKDGNLDILVAGNLFSSEIETPRNDASYGVLLTGDGHGDFQSIPFTQSGFYLGQDTKDLAKIKTSRGEVILSANNNDYMKATLFRDIAGNKMQ